MTSYFTRKSPSIVEVTYEPGKFNKFPAAQQVHEKLCEACKLNAIESFIFACNCERCGDMNSNIQKVSDYIRKEADLDYEIFTYVSVGSGGLKKDMNHLKTIATKAKESQSPLKRIDIYFVDPIYSALIDLEEVHTKNPSAATKPAAVGRDGCDIVKSINSSDEESSILYTSSGPSLLAGSNDFFFLTLLQAKMEIYEIFKSLNVVPRMFVMKYESDIPAAFHEESINIIIQDSKDYHSIGSLLQLVVGDKKETVDRTWCASTLIKDLLLPRGLFILNGYKHKDVHIQYKCDVIDMDDTIGRAVWKLYDNFIVSRMLERIATSGNVEQLRYIVLFTQLLTSLLGTIPKKPHTKTATLLFSASRGIYRVRTTSLLDNSESLSDELALPDTFISVYNDIMYPLRLLHTMLQLVRMYFNIVSPAEDAYTPPFIVPLLLLEGAVYDNAYSTKDCYDLVIELINYQNQQAEQMVQETSKLEANNTSSTGNAGSGIGRNLSRRRFINTMMSPAAFADASTNVAELADRFATTAVNTTAPAISTLSTTTSSRSPVAAPSGRSSVYFRMSAMTEEDRSMQYALLLSATTSIEEDADLAAALQESLRDPY